MDNLWLLYMDENIRTWYSLKALSKNNNLISKIREEIDYSLTNYGLFPDEQKGYRKGPRGAGYLLYIDQLILNESKIRWKNLSMAWIDYKKTHGMVQQSWKINSQNVQNIRWSHKLYRENHENLENGIVSRRKKLSWKEGPQRKFQGDARSPLLLIIAIIPLNHKLRKYPAGYKLSSS